MTYPFLTWTDIPILPPNTSAPMRINRWNAKDPMKIIGLLRIPSSARMPSSPKLPTKWMKKPATSPTMTPVVARFFWYCSRLLSRISSFNSTCPLFLDRYFEKIAKDVPFGTVLSVAWIVTTLPPEGATKHRVAVCLTGSIVIFRTTDGSAASIFAENPEPIFDAVTQTVDPGSTSCGPLILIMTIQ